jgi:hypothetical protein
MKIDVLIKKILVFALLIGAFSPLFAQRQIFRTVESFENKVEISLSGGVHALHLVQSKPLKGLWDELKPSFQASVGYQFTSYLGARFAFQSGNTMSASTDTLLPNYIISTHIDMLVDVANFWNPETKNKSYDTQIIFGAGTIFFRPENKDERFTGFAFNGGLLNSYHLTKDLFLNLELKLFLINEAFSSNYNPNYGGWSMIYDASLGLSYRIPIKRIQPRSTEEKE